MKERIWLAVQIAAMLVMWVVVLGMFASIIIAVVGNPWYQGWTW